MAPQHAQAVKQTSTKWWETEAETPHCGEFSSPGDQAGKAWTDQKRSGKGITQGAQQKMKEKLPKIFTKLEMTQKKQVYIKKEAAVNDF